MDPAARLLEANSFERVLERGFALVTTPEGLPIKRAAEAAEGAEVTVRFADAARRARLDPSSPEAAVRGGARLPPGRKQTGQDSLF